MNAQSLSRRATLAGILTLSATTAAVTLPAAPDPIFAAIEGHRREFARFEKHCCDLDDEDTVESKAEWYRLWDRQHAAAMNLIEILPTTLAGVGTLLAYASEHHAAGYLWPDDVIDESIHPERTHPFLFYISRHAADAIEAIGA